MLLNLKCIVLPLLALYTVNTVLSAWAAESWATKDGTSSAVGTASTIGTFEQHHHHRRWRRGNSGGHPSLGSLRRGALRSKSGQSVADEILPIDGTDNKSSSWLDNLKSAFKPASQQSHDKAVQKVREHQRRLALEVVLAQNVEQLHQRKELLKMALFYEQTLNFFSNELVEEEANLQNGTEQLIKQKSIKKSSEEKNRRKKGVKSEENKKQQSAEGKNKGKGLKSEEHQRPGNQYFGKMQKGLVGDLQKRVDKLRKTKGHIKTAIDKFGELAKIEDFNFGSKIYSWDSVRDDTWLREVLNRWEGKKPDDWGKNNLKIWMRNNTKSDDDEKTHPLYKFAMGQIDTITTNLVNQILLVDAAFDREARNLCLNAAFVVPMRNWAEISQKMTDEQIEEYVTNVLGDNFLGLQITFEPNIGSTFNKSVDFEQIEDSKKRNKLKTFKHKIHNTFNPYSSRGPETHLKQLEAKNTKLSWDILKAISREERINAQESVKLAVYLMMLIEKAYSDEVTQKIEAAKKAVECQRREVKKVEKEHKRARNRSHVRPIEHQMTPSISERSSNSSQQGSNSSQEGNNDDDDEEQLIALAKFVAKSAGMLSPIVEVELEGTQSDTGNHSSADHDDSDQPTDNGNHSSADHNDSDQPTNPAECQSDGSQSDNGNHSSADQDDSDQPASPTECESEGTQSDNSNYSSADQDDSDQTVSSPMLDWRGSIKQKVKESREQLAAAKAHHHKLIGSQKETKKSRKSLYQLEKSKSASDGFATFLDSIKTKAKGNEIYEEINGQIVENAKQELQLQNVDRLDVAQVKKLVEKHMREVFAKGPGKQFLLNMIELSKQLTEAEIRRCVEKFRWFRGCKVQINAGQITQNGSGKRPPVRRQIISDSEDDEPKRPRDLPRPSSAASTSSTQRRADGSRLKSKSTKSEGKRHHTRR